MATVSGTFTAVGQSATLDVPALGEDITISLSGGATATVLLQRERVPHADVWHTVRTYFGNVDASFRQERKNERYRFNCTSYTSGTVTYSVSDGDKVVSGTPFVDSVGNVQMTLTQAGVDIPGTLTVDGAVSYDGGINTGTLDLASGSITDSSGAIDFGNETLDTDGTITSGTLVIGGGTITDTSAAISFGNENLSTTGTLAAGVSTLDGIAGGDSALGIAGEAAAQGGSVDVTGGTSSTAANAGGAATITGGTPGATGIGGAVTVAGGAGTAVASGTGAAGGANTYTTGAGAAGTSGASGGASGALTIATGVAGTTDTGTGGASGAIIIETVAGGLLSGDATNAAGASGALTIRTGAGGAHAAGAAAGGAGGDIAITGGAGGEDTEDADGSGGRGADITVTAGKGGDGETSGRGGNVIVVPGDIGTNDMGTAPIEGAVFLRKAAATGSMPVFFHTDVFPAAKTTDTTLTVAEVFGQVLVIDDGGSATATMTLPTGNAMTAAAPTSVTAGDSFYFHVINEGTTDAEIAVIAAGSQFLLQGSGSILELDAATNNSSAMFLIRNVSADNWTCTRVA